MIYLDKSGAKTLSEQLFAQIKQDIVDGKLVKNAPLKSLRVLCEELNVSRNTVDNAYQQLIAEGYVRSAHGKGYFVEDISSNDYSGEAQKPPMPVFAPAESIPVKKSKVRYDFEYESIESSLFPWAKWRKYANEAILLEEHNKSISYETSKGNRKLREALCGFLYRHRGVNCDPERIILCAGTQYAMEIISTLLPPANNRIAFEEPGYAAMRYFLENKGYGITSVPVTENGVHSELLTRTNCNILYTTPSHQFPTGTVTTIGVRNQLLKWANTGGAYIIENDYDSEFRYGMSPIPSLQSLDRSGRVIYMNTLSKILSPTIRCAFLILPPDLLEIYERKYRYFNASLPAYHQIALADMIFDGTLERHLRKISSANEKKYLLLVKAIKDNMHDYVKVIRYPAGVHTLVKIEGCKKQEELLRELEKQSIRIYGIKEHCRNSMAAYENVFIMGFNSLTHADIANGCRKMGEALKNYFQLSPEKMDKL